MSERVPCKSPGYAHTILPVTAAGTGGYCMPCVQAKARAEREEYIRQNRVDANPYEDLTDPVEIIKVIHQPRKYNPLERILPYPQSTEELYEGLAEADTVRLQEYATSLLGSEEEDQAEAILPGYKMLNIPNVLSAEGR